MTTATELNSYVKAYEKDEFAIENMISMTNYVQKCITYAEKKTSYLELGIGHGIAVKELCKTYKRVVVIEGSPLIVQKFNEFYSNLEIIESLFEEFVTNEKFPCIGMGFVLEHVDDPISLLIQFQKFLTVNGSIFVGVPNAESMHRLLALKSGLINKINILSELDKKYGHKRYFSFNEWCRLFQTAGLQVIRAEGLYMKPFSTWQMQSLNLEKSIFKALGEIAMDYPSISNNCFFELKVKSE